MDLSKLDLSKLDLSKLDLSKLDPSTQIALLGIFLAIYLYLMPKFLKYKEYKEKKRETMFNWVHENLTEDVYIPLAGYTLAISDTLLQEGYEGETVLYRISKFLHYIFKNREIFGSDLYFTPNEHSNRLLETISERITKEINAIY